MKATSVDKAKRLDIYCRKDGSFERTLLVKNASDDSDYDFTGHTVEFFVVDSWFKTPRLTLTDGDGLTVATGSIQIEIEAADLNIKKEDLYYFLWVTDADNKKYVWLNGRFIVNHQLFDGVTSTDEISVNDSPSPINIIISADGSGESTMPTFANGNTLDENNVAKWGGSFIENTVIQGGDVNLQLGATGDGNDTRLNRFILHVTQLLDILMPVGGTWRAISGTLQILMNSTSITMLHDKLISFGKFNADPILNIITENDGDTIVPSIQAKVPIAPPIVYVQEELDALDVTKYNGHLVFKDFSSSIARVKQPIYSDGAAWRYIIQLLDIDGVTLPQAIPGSGVPVARLPVGEGNTEANMTIKMTVAFELLSVVSATISAFADFVSGDLTLLTITKTTPGIYLLKMEAILLSGNRWMLTGTVTGPGDVNISGALYFEKDPAEFFDLFVTGGCVSSGQFSRLYWYYEKQSY